MLCTRRTHQQLFSEDHFAPQSAEPYATEIVGLYTNLCCFADDV